MLQIRSEQLAVLEEVQIDFFASDLESKIKMMWPDVCERVTIEEIRRSVDSAKNFGFASRVDVSSFVFLNVGLGEHFLKHPVAYRVLHSSEIDADSKIPHLLSLMLEPDWAAGTQLYGLTGAL